VAAWKLRLPAPSLVSTPAASDPGQNHSVPNKSIVNPCPVTFTDGAASSIVEPSALNNTSAVNAPPQVPKATPFVRSAKMLAD
jgi:hypothetical protein